MWVCLNDCFLSIVTGPGLRRDELLVRARRHGDIGKLFPNAKVKKTAGRDYLYRAVVRRRQIADALAGEVQRIAYDNFKDSVRDRKLHDAYMRVWVDMLAVQPAGKRQGSLFSSGLSLNVRRASGGEPYEVPPHTEPRECLHCQHSHKEHILGRGGAFPCRHFGCGCSDYEPGGGGIWPEG